MFSVENSSLKYRSDIDGLRALAVLAVVAYHGFPSTFGGGFIGVDIFFVISGFLITSIIQRGLQDSQFTFSGFYFRRVRRIFPALILVMICSWIFGWFFLVGEELKQLSMHLVGGASFSSNFVLWRESGYFDNSVDLKPLLHLWSLAVEEQFYIIWPLILFLCHKFRNKGTLVAGTLFLGSLVYCIYLTTANPVGGFYSPLSRGWEIFSGGFLASINLTIPSNKFKNFLSFIGVVLLALGFYSISKTDQFPGYLALLPVIGTLLMLASGEQSWLNKNVLSHKLLVSIGLISYPLYLWHWPLLSFARITLGEEKFLVPLRVGIILASFVLAYFTYILIEVPLRKRGTSTRLWLTLFLLMIFVGVLGGYSVYREGFSWRVPKILRQTPSKDWNNRSGTCFLQSDLGHTVFLRISDCIEDRRPLVVLWGDSHGAMLYPGLKSLQKELGFGIAQFTANHCPPILEGLPERVNCKEINEQVIDQIKKVKPEIVLLAASWTYRPYRLDRLFITVSKLKKFGVKSIFLIGPFPRWEHSLKRQLWNYARKNFLIVPKRMSTGLIRDVWDWDERLRSHALTMNIRYISPLEIFCDGSVCLTRVGDSADDLLFVDDSHLSGNGSEYFMRSIKNQVFGN